jgi:hypothetical protein
MTIHEHFEAIGACFAGKRWVRENCSNASETWDRLLHNGRLDWAVWWVCAEGKISTLAPFLRRIVLRAVREHAAASIGQTHADVAKRLRDIPDDASYDDIAAICRDAANSLGHSVPRGSIGSAMWSAHVAEKATVWDDCMTAVDCCRNAASLMCLDASEAQQQIADLRALVPCPWSESDQ